MKLSRRHFLKSLALVTALSPLKNVFASYKTETGTESVLNLYSIHTNERLNVIYAKGTYDREAIERINYLLRCHYTDEIKPIDLRVIDLLCDIKNVVGTNKEIHIISGYRSRAYNEQLRSRGRRVVKDSLHLQGLAVDFSIPGVSTRKLSDIAKSFYAGGVGKYSDFVHIDIGRVRFW